MAGELTQRPVVAALLAEHPMVTIHLDPNVPGVDLPASVLEDYPYAVLFELGYDMPVPIMDFTLDGDELRVMLSFGRRPYACVIPWRAVFLVIVPPRKTSGPRGYVWRDAVPANVIIESDAWLSETPWEDVQLAAAEPPKPAPPKLRLVK